MGDDLDEAVGEALEYAATGFAGKGAAEHLENCCAAWRESSRLAKSARGKAESSARVSVG